VTAARLSVLCLVAAGLVVASPRAEAGPTLVIEAESGRVLHAIDPFVPWYPASVTKILTAYLVFRAVESGRLTLDTPILISEEAAAQPPSKMGFPPGTAVTVDDALRMLMVKSANDIAVALAEAVSGSVPAFAEEMNRQAAALGMRSSYFVNPHGLPDERQVTTARDLAVLARALLKGFPQHAAFFDVPVIRVGKRMIRNTNNLIGRYDGINGLKTGFTCASGLNIVATASRNGRQLIAVVLGARSSAVRAEITAALLEQGFATPGASSAPENIDTMQPVGAVSPVPVDLRPFVCPPRKKASPEEMLLVAVDPRIDLEAGRRALGGKLEDTGEGEDSTTVAATEPHAIATFSPTSAGDEAAADEVSPKAARADAQPKPAKPPRPAAKAPARKAPAKVARKAGTDEKSKRETKPAEAKSAKPAAGKASAKAGGKANPKPAAKAAAKPAAKAAPPKPAEAKPRDGAQKARNTSAVSPEAGSWYKLPRSAAAS